MQETDPLYNLYKSIKHINKKYVGCLQSEAMIELYNLNQDFIDKTEKQKPGYLEKYKQEEA